jgi:hypothetical protein
VRVRLSSLTLKDGSSVELADPGVTVVVGPNNSGKTLLLREITMLVTQQRPNPNLEPRKILYAVDLRKEGPADELLNWLTEQGFARPRDPRTRLQTSYRRRTEPLAEGTVRQLWDQANGLGQLNDLLVDYHATDIRLQLVGGASVPNFYGYDDTANQPLNTLYFDRSAEEELSALAKRAFGMPLTLNRYGAGMQLHVGVPGEPETGPPASRA